MTPTGGYLRLRHHAERFGGLLGPLLLDIQETRYPSVRHSLPGRSGGDASAIRDATGSDHRDANGVHHLRDKSHRQERRPALADHFAVMPDAIFATVLDLRDFSAVSGHRNGD